jgi:hypothetical protein
MRGNFHFRDGSNGAIDGNERLFCELTLREGEVVWDWNSLTGVDYKDLGPEYGNRPDVDQIIRRHTKRYPKPRYGFERPVRRCCMASIGGDHLARDVIRRRAVQEHRQPGDSSYS